MEEAKKTQQNVVSMITFTYTAKVNVFVGPTLTSLADEALGYHCKGDHIRNLLPHSLQA